jgi:predicted oxidoreductase
VISTAYIKSGHLLPLTADGQKTAFSHSFSHGLKALKGHLLGTCFFSRTTGVIPYRDLSPQESPSFRS